MSQFDQSGLTFRLPGVETSRGTNYTQPVADSTIPKAFTPPFRTLLIALLKLLREEASPSFPSGDAARQSRTVFIFAAKNPQLDPLFDPPIEINFEVWDVICAPVLDALAPLQPPSFWFSEVGQRNLEALLKKTLDDNHYIY
jgi:hypothetical protein